MSPSPANTESVDQLKSYSHSWSGLIDQVRRGKSWSGNERNCCFLNSSSGEFIDLSYLSGLDTSGDGRSLAFVDWDFDGDIDIWSRERTSPRVRFMVNLHQGNKRDFLGIKLHSEVGNRDGIGAVVEVVPTQGELKEGHKIVKSLAAGNLFLSQSSKWLHFGLGKIQNIDRVIVRWPGGKVEEFKDLFPGKRYLLSQGTGKAELWELKKVQKGKSKPSDNLQIESEASEPGARIVLPLKVPLPTLFYSSDPGKLKVIDTQSQPTLILIWNMLSSICQKELEKLTQLEESLNSEELNILPLFINDKPEFKKAIEGAVARIKFPIQWGFIEPKSVEAIRTFQESLFDRIPKLTVPLGFLLDSEMNVVALYRGTISFKEVFHDASVLLKAGNQQLHHFAPPFKGRWFTKPLGRLEMNRYLAAAFEAKIPEAGIPYFVGANQLDEATLKVELTKKYHQFARKFYKSKEYKKASYYFQQALGPSPPSPQIHHDYGHLLGRLGKYKEAEKQLLKALEIDPEYDSAKRALILIRELMRGTK